MKLVPMPKEYTLNVGRFNMKGASVNGANNDYLSTLADLLNINIHPGGNIFINIENVDSEKYELDIEAEKIAIRGSEKGAFYAISTLRQLIKEYGDDIPCMTIKDEPDLALRGFYFDITRGRVPKIETLYRLCDLMAYLKMNHLELYVEHSFEYTGMEEIWGDKTPITREEIKALDKYCIKNHIELVPSFSLFGHLYEILQSKKYSHLCEIDPIEGYDWIDRMRHHTIDITNPESLELIKFMIDDVIDLFTSDKFNICCDETMDLGTGKSKDYVEKVGMGKAYTEFVTKIADYVKSKGKKVFMWGDIVLKHSECMSMLPEGITMLNWDYTEHPSEENVRLFKEAGVPQVLCPAAIGWNRFINKYFWAKTNIEETAEYAKKYGALGMLTTDWGDFGHVNILESSFPLIVLAADKSWNTGGETNTANISFILGEDEKTFDTLVEISKFVRYSFFEVVWDLRDMKDNNNFDEPPRALKLGTEGLNNACKNLENCIGKLPKYDFRLRGVIMLHKIGISFLERGKHPALAEEIRRYMDEYAKLWRQDYKESELSRILDFFNSIADMAEGK